MEKVKSPHTSLDAFFKRSWSARLWTWGWTALLVLLFVWAASGMARSIMGWWLPLCT